MMQLFSGLSILLIGLILVTVGLVLYRPGIFDRMIGIGVIGTKTTVLLAYVGVVFGRPEAFVDIALTYGLLNLVLALGVARYLRAEGEAQ